MQEVGAARAVFLGQSAGAYAALIASTWFPGASVIACAPQTFSDAAAKSAIRFVGIRALSTPDALIDVGDHLRSRLDPEALRAVIIAAGELDNPAHKHFWMDYLHALRLSPDTGAAVFVVRSNEHPVIHGHARAFSTLLRMMTENCHMPRDARDSLVHDFLEGLFASMTQAGEAPPADPEVTPQS